MPDIPGYIIVNASDLEGTFDHDDANDQYVTIHYTDVPNVVVPELPGTTSPDAPKVPTQPVQTPDDHGNVNVPDIPGYHVDPKTHGYNEDTGKVPADTDGTTEVQYVANDQTIHVHFVDQDGAPLNAFDLTGGSDTPYDLSGYTIDGYTRKAGQGSILTGYFDHNDDKDQDVTIVFIFNKINIGNDDKKGDDVKKPIETGKADDHLTKVDTKDAGTPVKVANATQGPTKQASAITRNEQHRLPQTGESKGDNWLAILGAMILGFMGLGAAKRRKKDGEDD
jgi:LPXTG-motif cell wall-anchored protein